VVQKSLFIVVGISLASSAISLPITGQDGDEQKFYLQQLSPQDQKMLPERLLRHLQDKSNPQQGSQRTLSQNSSRSHSADSGEAASERTEDETPLADDERPLAKTVVTKFTEMDPDSLNEALDLDGGGFDFEKLQRFDARASAKKPSTSSSESDWGMSSEDEDWDLSSDEGEKALREIQQEELDGLHRAAKQQQALDDMIRVKGEALMVQGSFVELYEMFRQRPMDWEVRCLTLWGLYQNACYNANRGITEPAKAPLQFLHEYLCNVEQYPQAMFQVAAYKMAQKDISITKQFALPKLSANDGYISSVDVDIAELLNSGLNSMFAHYNDLGDEVFMNSVTQFWVTANLFANLTKFPVLKVFSQDFYQAVQAQKGTGETAADHKRTIRWLYVEGRLRTLLEKFSKRNNIRPSLHRVFDRQTAAARALNRSRSSVANSASYIGTI
jgi:hypothetical protein